ncbi:MAG: hypothetical protein ABSE63_16420 [Thermoguttaceae bacterium]
MILRIGRVLAAVLLMLILLAEVRPAACQAASLFSPINSVTKTVTKTTKKVAKASVSTVKTVVTAPINLASKVGKTLTGKK